MPPSWPPLPPPLEPVLSGSSGPSLADDERLERAMARLGRRFGQQARDAWARNRERLFSAISHPGPPEARPGRSVDDDRG